MRRMTIALVAALVPAIAVAGPDKNKPEQQQKIEIDRFEWSTSQDSRLGVMVVGLNPELRSFFGAPKDRGLLVAQVAPDSPAARAGIRVGDVITKFGADKVGSAGEILSAIAKIEKPQNVTVEVVRDHKAMSLQAPLGDGREGT